MENQLNNANTKSRSSLNRKHKNSMNPVYNTKLPKIKRFINIYQSNGSKNSKKTLNITKYKGGVEKSISKENVPQKQDGGEFDPIKVIDSSPVNYEHNDTQSLDSSLDVIAASCEVNTKAQDNPLSADVDLIDRNMHV